MSQIKTPMNITPKNNLVRGNQTPPNLLFFSGGFSSSLRPFASTSDRSRTGSEGPKAGRSGLSDIHRLRGDSCSGHRGRDDDFWWFKTVVALRRIAALETRMPAGWRRCVF